MTNTEFLKVVQAYVDGKPVQQKLRGFDNWSDFDGKWNTVNYTYRIKPEEEYRPYLSAAEVLEDIKVKGKFIKCGSTPLHLITGIYPPSPNNVGTFRVRVNGTTREVKYMLSECTWPDGTPFGKKIEE